MNRPEPELLLRLLEGRVSSAERERVSQWLREDPSARAFLREVAEQSVMIADFERTAEDRQKELRPFLPARPPAPKLIPVQFGGWRWGFAAAAMICILAVMAVEVIPKRDSSVAKVAKVTGSSQFFGARGEVENVLRSGELLGVGDTIETRSCDAWVQLELRDGSMMTIAGYSTLRVLDGNAGRRRFKLQHGTLWFSSGREASGGGMLIETPTATIETRTAQFNIQASTSDTVLRVNEGTARATKLLDQSTIEVPVNHQVAVSLSRRETLALIAQPRPINSWSCDLWEAPEVKLGRWLPPTDQGQARLGAEPLLWPIPGRDPITLYAVAITARSGTERPVQLQSGSSLRIRGKTATPHTVRFGFSTQRMRGVFAGKFEVDVGPANLGPAGQTWEVELPLHIFGALQPQLASTPDGLELTDLYALTVQDDAGLEINHIELIPPPGS